MSIHETATREGMSGMSLAPRPAMPLTNRNGATPAPLGEQNDEPVWDLVRRVRKLRGLTQYQLADLLAELSGNASVSRDEVARWERGKRVPGPYWRQWLSVALDVPLDRLVAAVRKGRLLRAAR